VTQELYNEAGNIKAIILAGGRDFGRCPLASLLPAPLWPVETKPVLLRLLTHLALEGVKNAVICGGSDSPMYRDSVGASAGFGISFLKEPLPVGPAGCIRDAAGPQTQGPLLVLHGAMISPPSVEWLIRAHRDGGADMTVILDPPHEGCAMPEFAGIYVCDREVLRHIPSEGYCDIKEGLIPALWRAGKSVQTATLPTPSGSFRNMQGYLDAVSGYLRPSSCSVHQRARISPSARISGLVTIMEKAIICDDAVIIGPAIIEKNTIVESGAIISRSVLWAGAHVGKNAAINQCVVASDTEIAARAVLEARAVVTDKSALTATVEMAATAARESMQRVQYKLLALFERIKERITPVAGIDSLLDRAGGWFWFGLLGIAFFWLYWPEIGQLWEIWLRNDEYSCGLLVPLFAAYIVWSRREQFKRLPRKPLAAGLAVFFLVQALRFFGLFIWSDSAQRLSLVLSAAALVLYVFGWQLFRRMAPILLFLLLMLPIPNSLHTAVMAPLQDWATSSAVFSLETMGLEVTRDGNIIHLGGTTVAVAEACNGLRMVTAFFIISSLVVLLVERAWWEKVIIFVSALPIGLFCNTLRLTMTSLAFTLLKGPLWEKLFHDFGGLAMMPMALGVVIVELWILKRLTVTPTYEAEMA
jgi:exosortase